MVAIKAHQATAFLKAIEPRIVAVLVYGDDTGQVSEHARTAAQALAARSSPPGEILRVEDADLDADPRQLLISRLGADRALTRSEIDKLLVYAGGAKSITVEDVEAVVGDAADQAVDAILLAASGGDAG